MLKQCSTGVLNSVIHKFDGLTHTIFVILNLIFNSPNSMVNIEALSCKSQKFSNIEHVRHVLQMKLIMRRDVIGLN